MNDLQQKVEVTLRVKDSKRLIFGEVTLVDL